ncbi:hypothetical protein [Wolbachia endosymbiont of Aedes albopictus]|uniref:hypothetical protein n=1 Tax=Wolbachia endosymbiont of Aedes albopictus TaxID=167957 RepID=UPI0021676B92|nr:hypothetical protein [Wolbachia endosymbiont of Aedes albopictus]UVW84241.1 hypothetical protein NHG98_01880 [Wolbachia endosymbiont of Aedes albopictus]
MLKQSDKVNLVIPLLVSGIYALRYRGGMTVRGGITVCGGMTVKQFVIPQRDLLLVPRRYDVLV